MSQIKCEKNFYEFFEEKLILLLDLTCTIEVMIFVVTVKIDIRRYLLFDVLPGCEIWNCYLYYMTGH